MYKDVDDDRVQDEPTPCLFSGKLEDDADSRVTVSGCAGEGEAAATIASVKVNTIIQNILNLCQG